MPQKPEDRNYKAEYRNHHASKKAKKHRAARNAAHNKKKPRKGYEVDHKRPLSKGGTNANSNLRVVRRKVNRQKGTRGGGRKR